MSGVWEAVIGLEIHVQLNTRTKLFCGCEVVPGAAPNTNICPVCTGQPGALPVLNAAAVAKAVLAARALNCTIHAESVFARKQYFYPDLPKAYQISQYNRPYCEHGYLDIRVNGGLKRIGITRIHIEEDAGKNIHGEGTDPHSYVDLNRAGTPLLEIVSEPDMRSGAEAVAYMREIHGIVRTLGISDGDMERGNFRCDANVSVRRGSDAPFGTKTELKNLNSFRFVEKAIAYEIERQIAVLESGGQIMQETRLFDSSSGKTVSMRSKEEAHDYRYFPDPDLPPLRLSAALIPEFTAPLPELPAAKRARYVAELGITDYDADVLTSDPDIAAYFEASVAAGAEPKAAANWTLNEVLRRTNAGALGDFAVRPSRLAALLELIAAGTISSKIAKDVFERMLTDSREPKEIVDAEGLAQVSDSSALEAMVEALLAAHPEEVRRLREGEDKLLGFFMGKLMQLSGGKANPQALRALLQAKLKP